MTNAKRIILAAAKAAAREVVNDQLEESGIPCEMPECDSFSFGFRCKCGRLVCNSHLYFGLVAPMFKPEPICPSCIVDDHPELFEDL